MIALFDIGSTLIEGPPYGPARRLAELLALDAAAIPVLGRILFRSPFQDPRELALAVASQLRVAEPEAEAACIELWNAQLEEAYVLPGARELIAGLEAAGIRRAYLSNIWPPFYEHFRREFPREAAQPQFLSFQTGLLKPDPGFFHHALRALEARAEETVMIGDTYANDILPAIQIGLRTVWVLHRPQKERQALAGVLNGDAPAPNLTLGSIAELTPARLGALFGYHAHSKV